MSTTTFVTAGRLHDVMTAIRYKTTVDRIGRRAPANGEHHLRPLVTLRKLFPPDLLAATLDIAARCTFSLKDLRYEYPHEIVPPGLSALAHLRALTDEGCRRRWPHGVSDRVRAQIERELTLIEELKYEHFFLTVAELVTFARSRGILCQGRGSAANSAVCFALHITEVDPARISMLFERFISRARHEPPTSTLILNTNAARKSSNTSTRNTVATVPPLQPPWSRIGTAWPSGMSRKHSGLQPM